MFPRKVHHNWAPALLIPLIILVVALLNQPAGADTTFDCTQVTEIPQGECEALVAFYNATGGEQWSQPHNWLESSTPCSWTGVNCSLGQVNWLVLGNKNLSGTVPPEIGSLSQLARLDLQRNRLVGLPAEIGQLSNLVVLLVNENELTALPAEVGNLTPLQNLRINDNALTTLPAEIGNLTNLQFLYAHFNPLTALPPEIGNLASLETLWLAGTNLQTLPAEIGNLQKLEELRLDGGQLTQLPPTIGNLTTLRELSLSGNQLSTLPAEIGDLDALVSLSLYNNQLTALPPEMSDMASLNELRLGRNRLSSLPATFGEFPVLERLWLDSNQFSTLPAVMGELTTLLSLSASFNDISALPPEIGSLSNLRTLSLTANALSTLPPEFGNLSKLSTLYLIGNQFSTLPPQIGDLNDLDKLHIRSNWLTALPPEIGNLTDLNELYAGYNLIATIPPEIANIAPGFDILDLQHNQLTSLPPEFGNIDLLKELWLNDNPLSGPLPSFLADVILVDKFAYHNTQWCVAPNNTAVQGWLDDIPVVVGTGLDCSNLDPGAISGQVTDEDSNPLANVLVTVYRDGGGAELEPLKTTTTDADGNYLVSDLDSGIDYFLFFDDPGGRVRDYFGGPPPAPLSPPPGETLTGIDMVLLRPVPPRAEVETAASNQFVPSDGTVVINMPRSDQADIRILTAAGCGSELDQLPEAVYLDVATADNTLTYEMTHVAVQQFEVTIPAGDITDNATLTVVKVCPDAPGPLPFLIGKVTLYDPSGIITDAETGAVVQGAIVRLYRVPGWLPKTGADDPRPNTCQSHQSKDANDPWSQPAPVAEGVAVNVDVTTVDPLVPWQYTDAVGYYGWDVPQGCWYVSVTADGYESLISPVVGVPAPVFDLDLVLTPLESDRESWSLYLPIVTR